MRTLQLTHEERIALFQEWVLPLFVCPARAYFPTDYVIAKVSNVYKVALRLNGRGLTLSIWHCHRLKGGTACPTPRCFSCGNTPRHLLSLYMNHRQYSIHSSVLH